MADICEISRLKECMEAGEHEPLEVPGDHGPFEWTGWMSQKNITFGKMQFCKRCGLVYWEPKNPSLEFTIVDPGTFEESDD